MLQTTLLHSALVLLCLSRLAAESPADDGPLSLQIQDLFPHERFPNIVTTKRGTLLTTYGNSKVSPCGSHHQ